MAIGSGRIAARSWRVTIEELIESIGDSGAPVQTWQTLMGVFMARESMRGDEQLTADRVATREMTRWLMPFDPSMDPDLVDVPKVRRLRYAGRQHDIVHAARVGETGSTIECFTQAAATGGTP